MQPTPLNESEKALLDLLKKTIDDNQLCPDKIILKHLADKQHIRIERYTSHGTFKTISCRVVWILQGDYAGKHTKKPAWLQSHLSPIEVIDGRSTAVQLEQGLITPAETISVHRNQRNVTILDFPWEEK